MKNNASKTINVIQITKQVLEIKWGFKILTISSAEPLFIRCNAKGSVNWEVASVYKKQELADKKHSILGVYE